MVLYGTRVFNKHATCILQGSPEGHRQQVLMQWRYTYIKPHGTTCYKTIILTLTTMRTSNLTYVLVYIMCTIYHVHHIACAPYIISTIYNVHHISCAPYSISTIYHVHHFTVIRRANLTFSKCIVRIQIALDGQLLLLW
jgi:hypothetical protein